MLQLLWIWSRFHNFSIKERTPNIFDIATLMPGTREIAIQPCTWQLMPISNKKVVKRTTWTCSKPYWKLGLIQISRQPEGTGITQQATHFSVISITIWIASQMSSRKFDSCSFLSNTVSILIKFKAMEGRKIGEVIQIKHVLFSKLWLVVGYCPKSSSSRKITTQSIFSNLGRWSRNNLKNNSSNSSLSFSSWRKKNNSNNNNKHNNNNRNNRNLKKIQK